MLFPMQYVNGEICTDYIDGESEVRIVEDSRFSTRKKWYGWYQTTDYWKELRLRTIAYCHGQCVFTGNTTKLHMHHNNYNHFWEEIPCKDVIMVCASIHNFYHKKFPVREGWEEYVDVSTKIETNFSELDLPIKEKKQVKIENIIYTNVVNIDFPRKK